MIRVGVGGWTYEPWRGPFYPKDLKHADELKFASRRLTTIEINGTFYRTQSAASFQKWREESPDGFVFSVKGHRAVVNSRKLADAGEPIQWFFKSGVLELGEKLGPVLWQFAPFRRFNAEEIAAFLQLLPRKANGRPLRHAIEVRHESFLDAKFVDLLREHDTAVVFADSDDYPAIADVTSDFIYARLQRTQEKHELGYSKSELDRWAEYAKAWEKGVAPKDLPRVSKKPVTKEKRSVFIYMIAGAKMRCPIAAQALIERLAA
jgi:uncharacterized protein YecE (DUF72 family)